MTTRAAAVADHGATAGITRIGRITGLDRLGVEVWQAIRPLSRSLSVHAGKGLTADAAIAGAVGEAVEFSVGEGWWRCDLAASPCDLRAAGQLAWDAAWGSAQSTRILDWTGVEPLAGPPFHAPTAAICLDFCRPLPEGMRVSSCGGATDRQLEVGTARGLLELIERDAVGHWLRRSLVERSLTAINVGGQLPPAIEAAVNRARNCRFAVRFFAIPPIMSIAVAGCEIRDLSAPPDLRIDGFGSAARPDWPTALADAFLEAAQVRACIIAGARDELVDPRRADSDSGVGYALPMPAELAPPPPGIACPADLPPGALVAWLCQQLVEAGYPHVGRVLLSDPGEPLQVVRAVVPGLERLPPSAAERWLNA